MKLSYTFFLTILILVTLSAYRTIADQNVNLIELSDKNFTHIFKFDKQSSSDEIDEALLFLNRNNPSIKINRSIDYKTGNVSLEIKSETVICRSSNFEYAIILLDEDNQCQCAIGDNKNDK